MTMIILCALVAINIVVEIVATRMMGKLLKEIVNPRKHTIEHFETPPYPEDDKAAIERLNTPRPSPRFQFEDDNG